MKKSLNRSGQYQPASSFNTLDAKALENGIRISKSVASRESGVLLPNPGRSTLSIPDSSIRRSSFVPSLRKDELSCIDKLIKSNCSENMSRFFVRNSVAESARALSQSTNIMLVTGSVTNVHAIQANGPVGAVALGHALNELGKVITYMTDQSTIGVVRAVLSKLSSKASQYSRILTSNFQTDSDSAFEESAELLRRYEIDAVVSIGVNKKDVNQPTGTDEEEEFNQLDALVEQAKRSVEITTVTVCDDIDQIGVGDAGSYSIVAPTVNAGSEAVAAVMLAEAGQVEKFHTTKQQSAMLEKAVSEGAVDCLATPVDIEKMSISSKHGDVLELIRKLVSTEILPGYIAPKTPTDDKPFVIGAFDSSNGGIIAAKSLAGFLQYRSNHFFQITIVADHGHAPYGDKDRNTLITLVGNGLKTAEENDVDVIAMACNTACTAFPEAKKDISVPVIDLIEVTATAIASCGGLKPCAFSTMATEKSLVYQQKVRELSEKNSGTNFSFSIIGVPEWASLVNEGKYLSESSQEDKVAVEKAVLEYVGQVPKDATSLWLCCTHYPALLPYIKRAMDAQGLRHIRIIDPMEYQAEAIIQQLNKLPNRESNSNSTAKTILITTAKPNSDLNLVAKGIIGSSPTMQYVEDFGSISSAEDISSAST
jgi:glutamate racemase